MSSPVSSRRWLIVVEKALEGSVAGGVVGGVVVPAVPDHVEPGAGEDARGVRVVLSAGDGLVVEVRGPGVCFAGVGGAAGPGAPRALVSGRW